MTTREVDALAALDFACWEDCEAGGQGWVRPAAVAALLEVSLIWAYQLLSFLIRQSLAERCRRYSVFHYAPTEQGADLLLKLDSARESKGEKR